jgi:hypothetical protein
MDAVPLEYAVSSSSPFQVPDPTDVEPWVAVSRSPSAL